MREEYTLTYPPMYVAGYSLIQVGELWQRGMKEFAKRKQADSRPGFLTARPSRPVYVIGKCSGGTMAGFLLCVAIRTGDAYYFVL